MNLKEKKMVNKFNILVFPGGTENGLEVHKSLSNLKEIKLFSVSSGVRNHADYVYEKHFVISDIYNENCLAELNHLIYQNNIDFIFPANDLIIDFLVENRSHFGCKVILPSNDVVKILRSKRKTYNFLKNIIAIPIQLNEMGTIKFPLFSKPDNGYGSQGIFKINDSTQLEKVKENHVVTEYLPGEEYSIDCFTDFKGKLLYCQGRTRGRIRMGTSMSCEFVDHQLNTFFNKIAIKILKKIKITGAWFFQMKYSNDGELKLLEISPRIAGTMAMNRVRGVNFPLLSILTYSQIEVSILINKEKHNIDRSLKNRYMNNFIYDEVYIDLDDTIIVHGKLNIQILQFLFQCVNRGVKIILLTKSLENNLTEYLRKNRILLIFDEIIQIKEEDKKSRYIQKNSHAIFIDDSFTQRKEVQENCNISTFDASMVEALLDDRI